MSACVTKLDSRVDGELIDLNQRATNLIPKFFEGVRFERDADGQPSDYRQIWCAYLAAEIYGAADSALLCVMHNRGRQAGVLERQIYECLQKCLFYANHHDDARLEFLAMPFRDKKLLDDMQTDKTSERYEWVQKSIAIVTKRFPDVPAYASKYSFRERPFSDMVVNPKDPATTKDYAFHYRRVSQAPHGSVLGMLDVLDFREEGVIGIKFDSRLDDPNFSIQLVTIYVITLLGVLNDILQIGRTNEVENLEQSSMRIIRRLWPEETEEVMSTVTEL